MAIGVKEGGLNTFGVVSCCSGVSGCIPMRLEARGNLGRLGEIFIGEGLRRILRWR